MGLGGVERDMAEMKWGGKNNTLSSYIFEKANREHYFRSIVLQLSAYQGPNYWLIKMSTLHFGWGW